MRLEIRRRNARWWVFLVVMASLIPLAYVSIRANAFAWVGGTMMYLTLVPRAVREIRTRRQPATVTVFDDRCVIEHPALLEQGVQLTPADLHSIVPIWLWPPAPPGASLWKRLDWRFTPSGVRPEQRLPLLGVAGGRHRPALLFVLASERSIPQSRAQASFLDAAPRLNVPVRGLVVAFEDLDVAQRAFQPWGLLARITPGALAWVRPRSRAKSPGPAPVCGA